VSQIQSSATPVMEKDLPAVSNEYMSNVLVYFAVEFVILLWVFRRAESPTLPSVALFYRDAIRLYIVLKVIVLLIVFSVTGFLAVSGIVSLPRFFF
jgi:hypothetical protein